jgi:MoxR-like ATPase
MKFIKISDFQIALTLNIIGIGTVKSYFKSLFFPRSTAIPDAFLRRCFFHYINFPEKSDMQAIVDVHFPKIKQKLLDEALALFFELRDVPGLKKKPSTSELIDWLKLLLAEDISPETLHETRQNKVIPPLHGALLKNEQDVHLFEKLAFMNQRHR